MKKHIKICLLFFGLAVLSCVLHNLVFTLFKFEEPVFFILVFVFLLAAIISVIYSIVKSLTGKGEVK